MARRIWTDNVAVAALTLVGSIGLGASMAHATDVATSEPESAATAPGTRADQPVAQLERLHAEEIQAALNEESQRLHIKSSQESEWKNFADAYKAMAATADWGAPAAAPSENEDGATLLHLSAERTVSRAHALEKLASAASKLQNVLDPNQREVFAQIARMRLESAMQPPGFIAHADGVPQVATSADPPAPAAVRGGGGGGHAPAAGGYRGGGSAGGGFHGSGTPGGFRGGTVGGFRGGTVGGFRGGPYHGGFHGGYHGHGFPGWWWGPGWIGLNLYLAALPWYYEIYWWGGIPYYFVDGGYYVWNGDVGEYEQVQPPAQITAQGSQQAPAASNRVFVYPKNGQTAQQQAKDVSECSNWASNQTGYTPATAGNENGSAAIANRQDYLRAEAACLEGRGYSVE